MKLRGDSTLTIIIIVIAIWFAWSSGALAKLAQAGAIYPPVPVSSPSNMSLPGSETLSKFVGALSAPPPQPPTLGDVQGQAAPAPQAAPTIVIRAYSTPVAAPTVDQQLGGAGGYFVINGYRLYCDQITQDLQYTGDEIVKEWWDSLSPELKRIQKGLC